MTKVMAGSAAPACFNRGSTLRAENPSGVICLRGAGRRHVFLLPLRRGTSYHRLDAGPDPHRAGRTAPAIERKSATIPLHRRRAQDDLHQAGRSAVVDRRQQDVAELGPDGKIALANALEAVKASFARAEDNRMICERSKKPLGFNRPENKCISVGQRRRMREEARAVGLRTSSDPSVASVWPTS